MSCATNASRPTTPPGCCACSAGEQLAGAHLCSAISPDLPHNPTCRDRDYDMASYSLFKTMRERFDDENSPYRLEPKQSYHAFRRHNR